MWPCNVMCTLNKVLDPSQRGISFETTVQCYCSCSRPQRRVKILQRVWLCDTGPRRCSFDSRAKSGLKCSKTLRCKAEAPILDAENDGLKCLVIASNLLRQLFPSNMCRVKLSSRSSTLGRTADFDENFGTIPSIPSESDEEVEKADSQLEQAKSPGRKFCKRCCKAAPLCICHHIKIVVKNQTAVTILQHPQEKKHHLGSARIALLGLENVELISIPEIDPQVSHRKRSKVPGSKRFIAGRGGKKAPYVEAAKGQKVSVQPCVSKLHLTKQGGGGAEEQERTTRTPLQMQSCPVKLDSTLEANNAAETSGETERSGVPHWIKLQPDAGLLFPSEESIDLWPVGLKLVGSSESVLTFQSETQNLPSQRKGVSNNSPSQLIVLDGTWSKAKRIFFENPWLQTLPHYRLPTLQNSRYGWLRREPKPGCLSTVESIVYALQLLEPETRHLESLLDVFDRMIEDQMRFMVNVK